MVEGIKEAFDRASKKHGEFPECKYKGLAIITEELGELSQSILDGESSERQKSEAIDIIIGCLRFIKKHY